MEGPGLSSQGAPQTLSRSFAHRSKQNLPDGCLPVFTTQAELGLEDSCCRLLTSVRKQARSAHPGQAGRRARPARDRQAGALGPPGRAADATSALALLSAKSP